MAKYTEGGEILLDKLQQRREWLKEGAVPPPTGLGQWLRETNLEFGCGTAALEAIEQLEGGAPAVITGQQAGLLTGPLYTVYKAASAVILARELSRCFDTPVVPVFWLASEDHDFQEVRSSWFPVGEELKQVVFPGSYSLTPAAEIPLTPVEVREVADQLAALLPVTDFTSSVLKMIVESGGSSFSSWCGGLLSRLFRDAGLVILDSCGLPVRLAAVPVFVTALEAGGEVHVLLADKAADMKAAGRAPSLHVPLEHSHIFFMHGQQRLALLRNGDRFYDRGGNVALSLQDLLGLAKNSPWTLSPNVVLRPLVQERVLPVLAVIAGPGELAYLDQMASVFPLFGLQKPPVFPRLGGTLLEPSILRLLDKYGLTWVEVEQGLEAWLQQQLDEPLAISEAFSALRGQISEGYGALLPGLAAIDKQLPELGAMNLEKVLDQVKWLERRARASQRQKHNQLLRHVRRLQTALTPGGGQQQRVHNPFWYINKYGPEFIRTLLAQPLGGDMLLKL